MRSILLLAFLPVCLVAAPALGIVKPAIAQSDGGEPASGGVRARSGRDDVLLLQYFRLY